MLGALLLTGVSAKAQFTETMGTPSGTPSIASYETANGFDQDSLTYSGTGDVRVTTPSTGYTGASGNGNIFLNTGKTFIIGHFGTNSCAGSLIDMTFGVFKSTTAENGSHMVVDYSVDGGSSWTTLSFAALPTGTGTAKWYQRSVSGLPATCNLLLRFTNSAISGPQFRIDDVSLSCGSALVSVCSASITANDTNVFCYGDSVVLTANHGDSYLWSNGATTQSVTIFNSGTFSVTVENSCCFATSAGFYVLVHNDGGFNPVVAASADDDTICPGDSVTLTARTLARDLFISQYQEGAGLDKAIEIYNGTGAAINLSDYEIRDFHNGACDNATASFTIALPNVMLNDGDVFVVANPNHSQIGISLFPDMTAANLQFNGDDAVTLFNVPNDGYVDIIGSICNDPGAAWTAPNFYRTEARTLTRKPCVYEGISVNPNLAGASGFPTLASEWEVDTLASTAGFGSHTMGANSYAWAPQPTAPTAGATVKAAPSGTTTYTVSGTYCDGCPYSATVSVVVSDNCGERHIAPASAIDNTTVTAQAYPNPFNGNVNINVNTTVDGLVKIEIVNVLGEKVAVVNNSTLPAGNHTFTWNGNGMNGATLADGVYSCNITTASGTQTVLIVKSSK